MRHKRSVCGVDLTTLLTIALMGCGKSDADKSATGNAAVDKTPSRPGYACHVPGRYEKVGQHRPGRQQMRVHADVQRKLIDGGEAEPLTFTREYDRLLRGLKVPNLPDGTKKPLAIQLEFKKFGPSKEIHFAPGSSAGPWPTQVGFTRDE
jgi:hypothetical protein